MATAWVFRACLKSSRFGINRGFSVIRYSHITTYAALRFSKMHDFFSNLEDFKQALKLKYRVKHHKTRRLQFILNLHRMPALRTLRPIQLAFKISSCAVKIVVLAEQLSGSF